MNIQYTAPRRGGPLEAVTASGPSPGPGDVIIRLKAVAINPADVKMVDHGQRGTQYPLVSGFDGAGIVQSIGSAVRRVVVGDEVLATFSPGGSERGGSFQTLAAVDETKVAKKPSSWSFEAAASTGICYFTAVAGLGIGLATAMPFIPGGRTTGFTPSSILVLGGSSAVGAAAIQLLKVALPECKILATSSPRHHSHLIGHLRVHAAIDRSSKTLAADVRSALSTQGVDAILDTVGAGSSEPQVFEALAPAGPKRYAQVWTGDEEARAPEGVDSVSFRSRDIGQVQGSENIMQGLQALLETGQYKLPLPLNIVGEGLDGLQKGLDAMRKGVSGEKLIVKYTEDS